MKDELASIKILDVKVTSASKAQILKYVLQKHEETGKKFYIVTPNPEILMFAKNHASFRDILNGASLALPDGIGVLMASKFLGKSIIGRITGVDFMQELCHEYAKRPITVGFLGGRGGVAKITADCLREKCPGLKVVFAQDEWDGGKLPHIDMLFVALGFPKQEEWIAKNLPHIDVTAAMTVGGAFDYISGKVPRAPRVLRSLGLEWTFRLMVQPSRFKRQLALPKFVLEVLKEKFS